MQREAQISYIIFNFVTFFIFYFLLRRYQNIPRSLLIACVIAANIFHVDMSKESGLQILLHSCVVPLKASRETSERGKPHAPTENQYRSLRAAEHQDGFAFSIPEAFLWLACFREIVSQFRHYNPLTFAISDLLLTCVSLK